MPRPRRRPPGLAAVAGLALVACAPGGSGPVDLGPGVVTAGPSASAPASSPAGSASPAGGGTGAGTRAVPLPFRDDEAEVEAEDQSGDGRSVRLEDVELSRSDGFAVVLSGDGARLLGSVPVRRSDDEASDEASDEVDDGPRRVVLAERLGVGTTELLVVLHADDGDGRLDLARDARVVDDDDELEIARFTYRRR